MSTLFCKTIGHSNREINQFLELIKSHNVNCIYDVRSLPYSRYNPQFNRETLKTSLELNDIQYVYVGDCLGARYDDPNLLCPDGMVDFKRVRQLTKFQGGIQQVVNGIKKGYRIALMCAEKDPFDCHRFLLVSYGLAKKGVQVEHIVSADKILSQKELENRMIRKYTIKSSQLSLFDQRGSEEDMLEEAYEMRCKDIAHRGKKRSRS